MPTSFFQKLFRRIHANRWASALCLIALFSMVAGCSQRGITLPPLTPTHGRPAEIIADSLTVPATSFSILESPPATLTISPTRILTAKQSPPKATAALTISPTILAGTPMQSLPAPTLALMVKGTETPVMIPTTTPTSTVTIVSNDHASEIGRSFQDRPIMVHQFGNGSNHIIVVGGIHGGYEWNTILLAYQLIDHFQVNPQAVPETITLSIIPSSNPDGQVAATGREGRFLPTEVFSDTFPGRLNGNQVDLNRNWDCHWQPKALWRDQNVSGGESAFSEPETKVLRDFILGKQPAVVIFLHSAANGVFASGCADTHQPSLELAQLYGDATGYPVYLRFSAYPITGDAGDWLSGQDIPSFSVELRNHWDLETEKNVAGMLAILDHFR